jgi:hypothetical protein
MFARLLAILVLALLPGASLAQSQPELTVDDYLREMDSLGCIGPEASIVGQPGDPMRTIRLRAIVLDITRLDRSSDPVSGGWRYRAAAVFRSIEPGDRPMALVLHRPSSTSDGIEHWARDAAGVIGCFQLADYLLLNP